MPVPRSSKTARTRRGTATRTRQRAAAAGSGSARPHASRAGGGSKVATRSRSSAGRAARPVDAPGAGSGEKRRLPGPISDAAVQKATGRPWSHWLAVLDRFDVGRHGHQAAATHLYEKHGVNGWWAQMVTVQYEQERGLREKYQTPAGYSVSVSRTMNATVDELFEAWNEPGRRLRWLPEPLTIRKGRPGKSLRITWGEGPTGLDVYLYPKGPRRAQINVQHQKLPDSAAVERMRRFWSEALDRLRAELGA
jgi:uncharacterized protein YndB with AHSA1/START domain